MMIKKIIKKLGIGGILIFIVIVVLYTFAIIKKNNRENNSEYIQGVSIGLSKGVKGNLVLDYEFVVGGDIYRSFVPGSFCDKCSTCCQTGSTVIVRYELENPENNDLVLKIPK